MVQTQSYPVYVAKGKDMMVSYFHCSSGHSDGVTNFMAQGINLRESSHTIVTISDLFCDSIAEYFGFRCITNDPYCSHGAGAKITMNRCFFTGCFGCFD